MFSRDRKLHEVLITLPSFIWLIIFFLLPTLIIFIIAFKPQDIYGGIEPGWTLQNMEGLLTPQSLMLIWRTFWVSTIATAITIIIAIPVGYFFSRVHERWRNLLLLGIILPFWTSFLVRIFAWKSILHPEAFFKKILVSLYLVSDQTTLLYNLGAVIFIMVYTYLPFAILPIYAAASKFDFHLIEAALDLGAKRSTAFFRIFLPGIAKGVINATIIVLIPTLGAYVIPDVVGGPSSDMIGNRIGQKVLVARNLPEASVWSMLLTLAILLPTCLGFWLHKRSRTIDAELRNKE